MPTQERILQQLQFDQATKSALLEHGDDETKVHVVEHHFFAADRAALAAVAKVGRKLGFGASELMERQDEEGNSCWYFDILSKTTTYLNSLSRQSLLMAALAEAHGADYDGWGTLIAK